MKKSAFNLKIDNCMSSFLKYEFWLNKVVFLGHVVFGNNIFVDPKKIEAVVN